MVAVPRSPLLVGVMSVLALAAAACSSDDPALVAGDRPTPTAPQTEPAGEPDPGSDDGVVAGDPDPTPTAAAPAPTPTPDPTPSATAAVTTEPQPQPQPGECTAGLAGDPTATVEAPVDLDADGAPDLATTYVLADGSWHLRVDTSAGESLDSGLDVDPGPAGVRPLGSVDLNGDPSAEELLVVVGAGAATEIVALFVRDRCDLVQIKVVDVPITFPVGASVGAVGGLECLDDDGDGAMDTIVAWSGIANFEAGEGVYDVDGVVYRVSGDQLEPVGDRRLRAQVGQADFVYGQLSCGALSL